MFCEYTLMQLNYNRMYDFDNYDETFQENYGGLIIENLHLVYKLYIDLTNYYQCERAMKIGCFFMKAFKLKDNLNCLLMTF